MQIKQTNEVLSCEHTITQSEIISALMKYMYTLSLFTRQFQCKKKKNPKNSIVSILILMTLYHSNDANNKSKEVNIIDHEEQIICKLILNDRRIPSSHSAPSKVLVPAPSDTRGSSPFVSALFDSADRAWPLSVPKTLFTSYRNEG